MDPYLQVAITVAVPTLAVLLSSLLNNARIADVNSRIADVNSRIADVNSRIADVRSDVNDRLKSMGLKIEARFTVMDVRFDALDERIDSTRDLLRAEFRRVEEVVHDARLHHLEERK